MKTNTEKYEAEHGTKPKGTGTWVFEITVQDKNGSFLVETYAGVGTLAKARAMAIREMKAGCSGIETIVEVELLP